ncbi:MAG: hypothetical protein K0R54_5555 [Clostridiaceae bacterium]|jgi:hypothetical protein|nr:hypothetical protein [Clostridiaceae bacterium]
MIEKNNKHIILLFVIIVLFLNGCSKDSLNSESDDVVVKDDIFVNDLIISRNDNDNKVTLISINDEVLNEFDNINPILANGLIAVKIKGAWGYANKQGEVVISPDYMDVSPFLGKIAAVKIKDKFGFIDLKGNLIVEPQYEGVAGYNEGLWTVGKNGLIGFVDESGNEVIQCQFAIPNDIYAPVYKFTDGLAAVYIDGGYALIDKKGNIVSEDIVDSFVVGRKLSNDGMIKFTKDGKYGFINAKDGKTAIQALYDYAEDFSNGLSCVELEGKWGCINKEGNYVIEPVYDYIGGSSEGVAYVMIDEKYGFVDESGKIIIEPIYDDVAYGFSDGLACVKKDGKFGVIDKEGKFVIQPIYESNITFSDGMGMFFENDKVGFIDTQGNIIVKPELDPKYVRPFSNGYAYSKIEGVWHRINKKGEIVTTYGDESVDMDVNKSYTSFMASMREFYDNDLDLVFGYDGYAIFYDSDAGYNAGIISRDGEIIIEPKYGVLERIIDNDVMDKILKLQ